MKSRIQTYTLATIGITFLAILLLSNIAFAQTATNTLEKRQEVLEQREARAASTTARQEVREENKSALALKAQARIINLIANISNRVDAAIARFEGIIKRIESRIVKLDAEGFDMSVAQSILEQSKNTLAETKAAMTNIDSKVTIAITSENPREAFTVLRTLFIDTKTKLIEVKSLLRKTIAEMKRSVAAGKINTGVSEAVSNNTTEKTATTSNEQNI